MPGKPRQRSPGSWTIVYDLPRDPATGRRRQKSETIHGTKRDAQRILNERLATIARGDYREPCRLTFGELAAQWLAASMDRVSLPSRTIYAAAVQQHLIPRLGAIPLTQFSARHLEEFEAESRRTGRLDGKGGLGPQTIINHRRIIRQILRAAVRWRLLPRDPTEGALPPPRARPVGQGLDVAAAVRLLARAEETAPALVVPLLLAVAAGLRPGEVCGARWEDLDGDLLHVRRQLRRVQDQDGWRLEEAPPKDRETRTVQLPTFAVARLAAHRETQPPGAVYLASPTGAARCPRNLSWAFGAWRRRQDDLPAIRLHDLRHSHASIQLDLGESIPLVAEILGHASPAVTLEIYAHVLRGRHEAAAARLDAAFAEAFAHRNAHRPEPEG